MPRTVVFASDGERYAAWQVSRGSHIVVYDTRRGTKRSEKLPARCELLDEAADTESVVTAAGGVFLLQCDYRASQVLFDVKNEASTSLPSVAEWFSLGARNVLGFVSEHTKLDRAVYDRETGLISYYRESEPLALEQPGASSQGICPSVRAALSNEWGYSPDEYAYSDNLLAKRSGTRGNVELDQCGGRRTILHAHGGDELCREVPRDFDLRSGLLTWDTGCGSLGYPEPHFRDARLYAYAPSSHTRKSWLLPRRQLFPHGPPEADGYSTHTADTVFWIGARTVGEAEHAQVWTESSAVYAARPW